MRTITVEQHGSRYPNRIRMLLKDSAVANEHIASIGFCMGGRASFLANATVPLQGAISFYGAALPRPFCRRWRTSRADAIFLGRPG